MPWPYYCMQPHGLCFACWMWHRMGWCRVMDCNSIFFHRSMMLPYPVWIQFQHWITVLFFWEWGEKCLAPKIQQLKRELECLPWGLNKIVTWIYLGNFVLTFMMTSSNGNIFRVTGHLCGEFTGHRWIPHTKASDAELWCFLWSASE